MDEEPVRVVHRRSTKRAGGACHLGGRCDGGEHDCGHDQGDARRRQQASDPPRVEPPEPDRSAGVQVLEQHLRDQVARQDEEHVHPDVTAAEADDTSVVEHHQVHGDRPQAVEVRPVPHAVDDPRGPATVGRTASAPTTIA
jgi:hypothetical protein